MESRDVVLKSFLIRAGKKKKLYTTFLRGIHKRAGREKIDKLARVLDKQAFAKFDCLTCGHCCKTMTPTYLPADIKRISKHLDISVKEFHDRYLTRDGKDLVNKMIPCQFLKPDNKCGIYDIRPVDCRGFPHTHKRDPGFVTSAHVNKNFFWRCPIVFHVVDNVYKHVTSQNPFKQAFQEIKNAIVNALNNGKTESNASSTLKDNQPQIQKNDK